MLYGYTRQSVALSRLGRMARRPDSRDSTEENLCGNSAAAHPARRRKSPRHNVSYLFTYTPPVSSASFGRRARPFAVSPMAIAWIWMRR